MTPHFSTCSVSMTGMGAQLDKWPLFQHLCSSVFVLEFRSFIVLFTECFLNGIPSIVHCKKGAVKQDETGRAKNRREYLTFRKW